MIQVMIMKDTEKKSNLEPWFCECSVFVLTFVFALGFFVLLFCFCATLGRVMGRLGKLVRRRLCRRLDTI